MKLRKLLAAVLAAVMTFSCLGMLSFAATKETVVKYGEAGGYLAIGDSIGRGCGSEGFYLDRDKAPDGGQYDLYELRNVRGAYTTLVAEALGCKAPDDMSDPDATFWPFCYPGMTTAVALDVMGIEDDFSDTELKYSYYKDALEYFGYEGSSVGAKGETFDPERDGKCGNIIELAKNADVITVELGMCDIFYRAYRIISKGGFLADGLKFDVSSLDSIGDLLSSAVTLLADGYKLWEKNYPMLIKKLQELNPDATIVMVGSFNVVNQMTLVDETMLPLGSLFSAITDSMNIQYEKWAKEFGVLYADVSNTETMATENDWSVLGDFLKSNNSFAGSHPSQNGHSYMARQILLQLPEKEETKGINVDLGRFDRVDYVFVNGIPVKNYELNGYVLTIPYDGIGAVNLTIAVKNDDGSIGIQTYELKYGIGKGYSAHRLYGNNDIFGFLLRPINLIKMLFDKIGGLIKG